MATPAKPDRRKRFREDEPKPPAKKTAKRPAKKKS